MRSNYMGWTAYNTEQGCVVKSVSHMDPGGSILIKLVEKFAVMAVPKFVRKANELMNKIYND